jgi:hypothetical protein
MVDKKKCFHRNKYFVGPTHRTLSVEGGKVTSCKGVLVGHSHYRCPDCHDMFAEPQWEVPMTVDHEKK